MSSWTLFPARPVMLRSRSSSLMKGEWWSHIESPRGTLNVSARSVRVDDPFCVVVFSGTAFHQFGPPTDEDLDAHPLASHGLRGFSAHSRDGLRHFVVTLRDSTFECVAEDCMVAGIYDGNGDIAAREAFSLCR